MKQLKRITPDWIMSWTSRMDWPEWRVLDLFDGRRYMTPLEIAGLNIPVCDILWIILREDVIPPRELRLIACWCAERALRAERAAGREPDARSWTAVRVSRKYAAGKATLAELHGAADAAYAAYAAGNAAANVAYAAAETVSAYAAYVAAGAWVDMLRHVRGVLRRIA